MTPLVELEPRWWAERGRHGMALIFSCPCCRLQPIVVPFSNPLDDGPPLDLAQKLWVRAGSDFEDLTLEPHVDLSSIGHWCGRIDLGVCHS